MSGGRLWTKSEVRFLRRNAGRLTAEAIGAQLGRPKHGVHSKMRALGLDGRLRSVHHSRAKTSKLQVAVIKTLGDAGFSAKEVHTLLRSPIAVTEGTVADIIAGRSHHIFTGVRR